jgi:hypothetical protein
MTPLVTHDEWQKQVIELGTMLGFKYLHVRKSIGGKTQGWKTTTNRKGWPDLFFWHPTAGGTCSIEIKVLPDKPKPEQVEVLTELVAAGIPSMVAYPTDLDAVVAFFKANRGTLTPTLPLNL